MFWTFALRPEDRRLLARCASVLERLLRLIDEELEAERDRTEQKAEQDRRARRDTPRPPAPRPRCWYTFPRRPVTEPFLSA